MENPFDNADGIFSVLANDQGQYSLWPAFVKVPAGWHAELRDESRETCLSYITEHWVDMRPRTLREASRQRR